MNNHLLTAGLLGATGVALGAFGAHGLPGHLESAGFESVEIAKRLETFVTGTRYQLYAALAVLAIGLAADRPALRWAVRLLASGAIIFSGLLYLLALVEGSRWLGAIVPLGGLLMIAGWVAVGFGALGGLHGGGMPDRTGDSLQKEVIRLEEVISHQQKLVNDLNEALTEMRSGSDETARRQQSMETTIRRLVDLQQAAEDLPDERPPHY